MGFTSVFKSVPPNKLENIALFILVWLWPAVYAQFPSPGGVHCTRTDFTFSLCSATLVYFGVMSYIVLKILGEWKPFCVFSLLSPEVQR
jgi:uncharacterized membrane protein (DUF4010 family)